MNRRQEAELAWEYFMNPSDVSGELATKLKHQFGGEVILTGKVVPTEITSDTELHTQDIRDALQTIDTCLHTIHRALDELEDNK